MCQVGTVTRRHGANGSPGARAARRPPRSVIRRPGVAGAPLLLESGDGLVDAAGVSADDPVDEAGRLVEVLGGGQQIGVLPDGVALVDAGGLGQALPQRPGPAAAAGAPPGAPPGPGPSAGPPRRWPGAGAASHSARPRPESGRPGPR